MNYLIAYDVKDNKKRKKIADVLEGFGFRVNYSVFECEVNKTKLKHLIAKIEEHVDKKQDSVRFYHICKNCLPKSFELCDKPDVFEPCELYL